MKRTLLLFLLLTIVISVGAKIIFAASENSNKPDSPPGQAKKEENSQGNQGNQGNSNNNNGNSDNNGNPAGQDNKPENPGQGNGQGNSEDKITFCHVPPGNPAQAHAITADRNAWDNGHSKHHDDFIVDGGHPCPPKNNPGGGGGGGDGSGGSGGAGGAGGAGGSRGTGGAGVSEKQGEVLGASVLAATGTAQENLAMLLQILGFGATLGAVLYGKSRPSLLS